MKLKEVIKGDQLKFLDFFSGIGGFRIGMELAGHTCIGHCEKDKFANRSYEAMHDIKEDEWFREDISKIVSEDIPYADVWCLGFPCQDISVAGRKQGLRGSRSGLFYKVIKLLKGKAEEDRPKILFVENVKNLLSVNRGWDFGRVLNLMDEAGYDVEWQVINTAWYLPQNRERVFLIGHLRGRGGRKVFPIERNSSKSIKFLGGKSMGNRIYDSTGLSRALLTSSGEFYTTSNTDDPQAVLTPRRRTVRQNGRRIKEPGEAMYTLTTKDYHGVKIRNRIRRITPKECFRLQGINDQYYEKAAAVNSETQLYKQAGNGVSVPVIYDIALRL